MAPLYGSPNYDFLDFNSHEYGSNSQEDERDVGLTEVTLWYIVVLISLLLIWIIVFFCLRIIALRQKTRSPQQRRTYMGSRPRQSLTQSVEPTIFVSPANLPPPPKYEAMAPPSYEEVVGIHYPAYQPPQIQPITHPITSALSQASNSTSTVNNANNVTRNNDDVPATVITVTADERRTSVTVATS